jgi:hypothetical protein
MKSIRSYDLYGSKSDSQPTLSGHDSDFKISREVDKLKNKSALNQPKIDSTNQQPYL